MYKQVLRSMEGIELFPSISLLLFFAFFVLLITYLIKTGKHHWDDAANLPLESDETINQKLS
ncbi:MAG: CcoQ/FixQ family Cbb3-type cytochrome c oxidase assembly chaperone [Balneola sp.]|nr:MAG: CcoQ/FixQ family Cbb3-type cytochrome c oxidase assembly chaperone [Balneola sp.]